jgi:hypothetical protein
MRIGLFGLAVAVPLALIAVPAQAQEGSVASAEIARGAWADAEKALVKELRIHPSRPELLLNLAAVYSNTSREAEARALYHQVLSQREVVMDLASERTAGSHAIARTGLRRIETVQLSAR